MFEVIPMVKNKQWKVLIIYSIVMSTAFTLTLLHDLGIDIPSPANPLKKLVTSIVGK